MSAGISLRWKPPGPVAAAFFADTARVALIMGPVGSAKTSTALMKIIYAALAQPASPVDGVRYWKAAVVRDTYRNLAKTTIPSWHNWVPRSLGDWQDGPPATHRLKFDLGGALIDLTVEFIALGEHRVEDVMRGWEGSMVYINEADLVPRDVLTYVNSRVGRYPNAQHGGCPRPQVLLDMNAPDDDNWTWRDFVDALPEGWKFYRQPSGLDPAAENLANLPADYYAKIAHGQPDWWVRRFVRNEFGYSRDGKPVYAEFSDARHVAAQPLLPVRGIGLKLGLDAGLTPAAVIGQRMPTGQWRILDELVFDGGGIAFGGALNRLLAGEKYRGIPVEVACHDPAANARAATDERTWAQVVRAATKLPMRPAPSNSLHARLEAVRLPLTRLIDGEPGLLLSPTCRVLRKGFNSGYRFRRMQVPGREQYADLPEKNEFSHVHDALQYLLDGGGEYYAVRGREQAASGARRQLQAITEDEPRGAWSPGGRQTTAEM